MKILGITGYIGSGKSSVCEYIVENYGFLYISTDTVAKNIINVDDRFFFLKNKKILSDDEIINVKNNLHPIVWDEINKLIHHYKNNNIDKNIIIETALPSKPFFDICDFTINVSNNIDIKTSLLKKYREYTEAFIDAILKTQHEYNRFYNKCDYNIINNLSKDELYKKTKDIIDKYILKG